MKRWLIILVRVAILLLLVGDIGGLVALIILSPRTHAVSEVIPNVPLLVGPPTRLPTTTLEPAPSATPPPTGMPEPTHTRTPAKAPTLASPSVSPSPTLPALYVDGAYIKRSDTHQPVWLKGVNVEEFRQSSRRTFADLYATHGLKAVTTQGWGINLLRIM